MNTLGNQKIVAIVLGSKLLFAGHLPSSPADERTGTPVAAIVSSKPRTKTVLLSSAEFILERIQLEPRLGEQSLDLGLSE